MDKRTNEELAQQLEREAVAFDYTAKKNDVAMVSGRDARDLAALMREAGRRLAQATSLDVKEK